MGEILRNATQVVTWLGEDDFTRRQASRAARFIHGFAYRRERVRPGEETMMSQPALCVSLSHRKKNDPWRALDALLRLRYFRRVWILQEVRLASQIRVYWGRETFYWQDLLIVLEYMRLNEHPFHKEAGTLISMKHLDEVRSIMTKSSDLLNLLMIASAREATDERDKLFAILSLVEHVVPATLLPDYSKSSLEISTDIAIYLVMFTSNFDFLVFAGLQNQGAKASYSLWPSWVPQWRSDMILPIAEISKPMSNWARADAGEPTQAWNSDTNTNVLFVKGLVVDIVRCSMPHDGPPMSNHQNQRIMWDMEEAWKVCSSHIQGREIKMLIEELLTAIVLGRYHGSFPAAGTASHDTLSSDFIKLWASYHFDTDFTSDQNQVRLSEVQHKLQLTDAAVEPKRKGGSPDSDEFVKLYKSYSFDCKEI